MGGHELGIIVGYEVKAYSVVLLQCTQYLRGPRIRFPIPNAFGVEDGGRRLFAVGVEDVGPGGDPVHVQRLACNLENGRTDPGARVPDRGVNVQAQERFQRFINSCTGIASVRPEAGSTTT